MTTRKATATAKAKKKQIPFGNDRKKGKGKSKCKGKSFADPLSLIQHMVPLGGLEEGFGFAEEDFRAAGFA